MARVVIHHHRARRESNEAGIKFVRRVLHEIRFNARLILFHGPYTTGHLAQRLDVDGPFVEGGRIHGNVGSRLPYAASVEGGARPHIIRPRPPKTRLKFYWRKVGRVVTPALVRHPGQRGKGYLHHAAQIAARRHNLLIVFYDV